MLSRFQKRCAYCGTALCYETLTIDHVIPKYAGGTNHHSNLYPSCETCNDLKAAAMLEEFRVLFRQRFKRELFYFETV